MDFEWWAYHKGDWPRPVVAE